MNRKEEYNSLLSELEHTPSALEYTVKRATQRAKKSARRRQLIGIPLCSLAVFFLTFVALVNSSPVFASACGRIPLIKELAAAVAFSPSLSAAVENQYVQPIEQQLTQDDITMRVEYVIVDQKQLNIFYSLRSPQYDCLQDTPEIKNVDGERIDGCAIHWGSQNEENGALRCVTIDFFNTDMPERLVLECGVYDVGAGAKEAKVQAAPMQEQPETHEDEPDILTTFAFELRFDPQYTQRGESIQLNQDFVLEGQRLTATTVDIYPTHMRLNLAADENNTAWLKELTFYVENEKGARFEAVKNGITATGDEASPMMVSHRLESSFFSKSEHLKLVITDVGWLDKTENRARIDLANATAQGLPQGVRLERAIKSGDDWQLTFSCMEYEPNSSYQVFATSYYDEKGNKLEFNSWRTGMDSYVDAATGEVVELENRFAIAFTLIDYPDDAVYFDLLYTQKNKLDTPIEIAVK